MSLDVRLKHKCLHQLEFVPLELDLSSLRELRLPYPVANKRDFVLYCNGDRILENTAGQFSYVLDSDELNPGYHKVIFQRPVRSVLFFFEASYTTGLDHCPRCHALEIEIDIRLDGRGNPLYVLNENKLKQEIERFETVERSSMVFHPELGTDLESLIGRKDIAPGSIQSARLALQVRNALEQLQRLQRIQAGYQELAPGEFLNKILSVSASRDPIEPTMYTILVRVSALSGRTVDVTKLVEDLRFRAKLPQ